MSEKRNEPDNKPDDSLDSLLDDALEDFNKPLLTEKKAASTVTGALESSGLPENGVLTEDVIKQATENFEASMRNIMLQQQKVSDAQSQAAGNGNVIPGATDSFDMNTLAAQIQKFSEAASNVAASSNVNVNNDGGVPDFQKFLEDAMKSVNANSQEFQQAQPSEADINNLLGGLAGGEENGLFPLMQSMLENILSKEIMYPPIKEIVGKYPDWLSKNKDTIESSEFDRYSRQFGTMTQVVELFESERESDSDEVKSKRFESLVNLMQKLQTEGHPPTELAGETPQNYMNFDPSGAGSLPDMGSLLGGLGGGEGGPLPPGGEEQCSLM